VGLYESQVNLDQPERKEIQAHAALEVIQARLVPRELAVCADLLVTLGLWVAVDLVV